MGFKNAVAQLKIRNPGLDVSGICPNKLADGQVIRDPKKSDPTPKILPMPPNFECEDYSSEEDPDFPWFSDVDAASSGSDAPGDGGGGGR